MAESLVTYNKALETQISQLAHTALGPYHKGHVNVLTTISENQVKNSRDNDKEVEESSDEKKVEIEENPLIPPEKEVVKGVVKETHYVSPPPYNPLIPFPQRYVKAKVCTQSKRCIEILEKNLQYCTFI